MYINDNYNGINRCHRHHFDRKKSYILHVSIYITSRIDETNLWLQISEY